MEEKAQKKDDMSDWDEALTEQGADASGGASGDLAGLVDKGGEDTPNKRGAERILNQEEIDNLLGFSPDDGVLGEQNGIRALINSALVSYERLPMLEIVFDRLVRLTTSSMRTFTSDNVEVSLDSISSVRFDDYLNSIPLPAILSVFRAEEWDNFGLITVDSNLIYSIIDSLLGGGRGMQAVRVEGRPYTTIEMNIVRKLIEIILGDAENAFQPLTPVKLNLERLETNPRFAAITRPNNAAILVELRVDMEDRGGRVQMLLPYVTIEPIRDLLLQMFMGEKFGRDAIWEGHLASEVYAAEIEVDAVLVEQEMSLRDVMALQPGHTVMFDVSPQDPIEIKCGDAALTKGIMGRIDDAISLKISRSLKRPKMSLAAFENAAQTNSEVG